MRHRVEQFAAVLLIMVAVVVEAAEPKLDMPKPGVTAVNREAVLAQCGPDARVGCTNFRDYMLTCNCVRDANGWRGDALASAVPQIYLTSFNYLSHEMLHIADFRQMLRA